ncbi:MAG TPA: acyl-CoA dehydrogenase family protein [Actinophytocola sp.]|uniref:acyl-CoA dehydrogenase family protein n=1 Tax=Actinophytocola sp. TaxID=1872138 RepID=UPI002DBC1095|nr:acyl-CoA dehydrogenase family protein [Actinophytocola sp.]HEU5471329.1 acyl-CoA dehydrogenase family protein [Actinophytocola sp.]
MTTVDQRPGLADVVATAERYAAGADETARFPTEALDALRASGLLGLLVPAEHGGAGGGLGDLVDVTMRLSRVDLSVGMIFAMHCQQAITLVRYARPRLAGELLPALGRGELYLASVTTERGTGGHLLTSDSPTSSGAGLLRIDRDAPIVTGGEHADGFLITLLAPDADSPTQVSLVYAAREQLALEVTGGWDPLGMRATHSVPMRLSGAVPEHQVVGESGGFRAIAAGLFGPVAHLGWAAAWLGTAAGALSRVLRLMRSPAGRRQFDLTSELLLTRLARIRGRLDTVHALLRHTVSTVDGAPDMSAPPVQLLVNTLKVQAAEQCFAAGHELVELVGLRHGYLRGSELYLERVFRDLRSASLNYANDRLNLANGSLAVLDQEVRLG